ncbi:hypothetical protein FACS1894105_10890 [Clostridia bacterium]|nr:hypothetical protein FACS1894105_10890 [Clostridia bacterium]
MATNTNILDAITDKDYEILLDAQCDFNEHGETDIACPRCGSKLVHEIKGTHEITRCIRPGCLRVTARGI